MNSHAPRLSTTTALVLAAMSVAMLSASPAPAGATDTVVRKAISSGMQLAQRPERNADSALRPERNADSALRPERNADSALRPEHNTESAVRPERNEDSALKGQSTK